MSTLLDANVKGSLPSSAFSSSMLNPSGTSIPSLQRLHITPTNPLDATPSSPQQIYLNLLILEASLRSQYLLLTLRRRKYTFFLFLLIIWTSFFAYIIFVNGPSPYYYIYLLQKLALGAGVMTLAIFWLSGLYKKSLVYPRKFVGNTNKGLRQFNIKLVSVRLGWWERIVGWLVIFPVVKWLWPWCASLPYIPPGELEAEKGRSVGEVLRSFLKYGHHGPPGPISTAQLAPTPTSTPSRKRRPSQVSRNPTPPSENFTAQTVDEEPLQPSGSHVKLVILPKGFSPDFREGWEIFRTDYWEKENERRAQLRKEISSQRRLLPLIFSYLRPKLQPEADRLHPQLHQHHFQDHPHHHPSPRRGTPEPLITGSRSQTPEIMLRSSTPDTEVSGSPPRRSRRSSTASLNRPTRRSISGTGAPTPLQTPPPAMAPLPLTPLRAEILQDAGDLSDAGSVRSTAGSVNDAGTGAPGSPGGKARRGGKKTRGSKRGRGGSSPRGGETGVGREGSQGVTSGLESGTGTGTGASS